MHVEQLRACQLETDFNFPPSVRKCIVLEEVSKRIVDGAFKLDNKLVLSGSADRSSIYNFLEDASAELRASAIELYECAQRTVEIINSDQPVDLKLDLYRATLTELFLDKESQLFPYFYPLVLQIGRFPLGDQKSIGAVVFEILRQDDTSDERDLILRLAQELGVRNDSKKEALSHLLRYHPSNWDRNFVLSDSTVAFDLSLDLSSLRLQTLGAVSHLLTRDHGLPSGKASEIAAYFSDLSLLSDCTYCRVDVDEFLEKHPAPPSIEPFVRIGLEYITDQGLRKHLSSRLLPVLPQGIKSIDGLHEPSDSIATMKNIVAFAANFLTSMYPGLFGPSTVSEIWFDIFSSEFAFVTAGTDLAPFTESLRHSYIKIRGTFLNGRPEAAMTYALESMWMRFTDNLPEQLFEELRFCENATIQAAVDKNEIDLEVAQAADSGILGVARAGSSPKLDHTFRLLIDKLNELAEI